MQSGWSTGVALELFDRRRDALAIVTVAREFELLTNPANVVPNVRRQFSLLWYP